MNYNECIVAAELVEYEKEGKILTKKKEEVYRRQKCKAEAKKVIEVAGELLSIIIYFISCIIKKALPNLTYFN